MLQSVNVKCRIGLFTGLKLFFLFVFAGTGPIVNADEEETLFNTINLQVQVEIEVPNNRMTVIMAVEKEGVEPQEITQAVNRSMQWAIEKSRDHPAISIQTGTYRTFPVYNKQTISSWRALQEIVLESEDVSDLSLLTGKLQKQLQVKNMSFSPSPALMKEYEDKLVDEGMQAFRNRAEQLRKHMNNMSYRIINIQIDTGSQRPPVRYEAAAVRSLSSETPPAVEAGSSRLIVTVSGSIQFF